MTTPPKPRSTLWKNLDATIEFVVPEEVAGLIEAKPLSLPAGRDDGKLVIRSRKDSRLSGTWGVEIRARSLQEGQWPVVSVARVELIFD